MDRKRDGMPHYGCRAGALKNMIHHSVTRIGSKLSETGHKPRPVMYAAGGQED
jgi:hypothetical protein